jgi:hypothetical protein
MAKFHRRVASLGPVLIPVNFQGPINSMHQVMPRRESRELSGYNRYGERIVANLELQIPDDVAQILQSEYSDLPRAAVEALALEGYRSKQFSEGLVRHARLLLALQVHAFLKEHGVHLNYSLADLEQDRDTSREIEDKAAGRMVTTGVLLTR